MSLPAAPTQSGVAKMIAGLLEQKTPPASLILMMRFSPTGKGLLKNAAAVESPAVLLQPLRDDPDSWKWLSHFPEEQVTEFARGFIEEARKLYPPETAKQ